MALKTPDELNADSVRILLQQGMRQAEIARLYNRSRQYISKLATTHCAVTNENTLRKKVMSKYLWNLSDYVNPWSEHKPFHQAYLDKMLRDHLEFVISGDGSDMSLERRKRLRAFYRKLKTENLVVEFHPNIRPNEHNSVGGFTYRSHNEAIDGTLMIRQNELTEVDEEGEVIWQLPPIWPSVDELYRKP